MKVLVKTLKGTHFEVEVKPEDTVSDVKKTIETVKGDVYPAAKQMLIHKGKVLEDDTTMKQTEVSEDSVFVVMLSKNNSSSPAPPPTPAAVAPPSPPPSFDVNSPHLAGIIHDLVEMGQGRLDIDTVTHALHAVYLDAEREAENLYNGIPDGDDLPEPPSVAAGAPPPPAPPTGPDANLVNLFPQDRPASASGNLNFLRGDPDFQTFRSRVQANPEILPRTIRELARHNPPMLGLIHDNQDEFFRMLFEPVEGEGIIVRNESGVIVEPPTFTSQDMEALTRLEGMGFNRSVVCEVFLDCDRNEKMAANYLLDHIDELQNSVDDINV